MTLCMCALSSRNILMKPKFINFYEHLIICHGNQKLQAISSLRFDRNKSVVIGDLTCGATSWDPNSSSSSVVAFGSTLNFVDTRKMDITQEVTNAHKGAIR